MNMPNKFLLIGLGLAIMAAPVSADVDLSSLFNQVQQQQSQLNNHDARITNNSKDIKALQENTSTAPASDPVSVPVVDPTPVLSASQSVAATPAPVVVASSDPTTKTIVSRYTYKENQKDWTAVCHYTYDDGSVSEETVSLPGQPDGAAHIWDDLAGMICQPVGTVVSK